MNKFVMQFYQPNKQTISYIYESLKNLMINIRSTQYCVRSSFLFFIKINLLIRMLRLRFLCMMAKSLMKTIPYQISSENNNQQLVKLKKYTQKLDEQFKMIYYELDREVFAECLQKYEGYNRQQKLFLMYQIYKNNKNFLRTAIPYSFRFTIQKWIEDFESYDISEVILLLGSFIKLQEFIRNNIGINFFRNSPERTKILKHLKKLITYYHNELKESELVRIYHILTCFHSYELMIIVEESLKQIKFGSSVIMQGIQYQLYPTQLNYEALNLDFHGYARWLTRTKYSRLKFQHRYITFLIYDRYELSRYVYGYLPIIRLISFLAHIEARNWLIQNQLINIEHEITIFLNKGQYKERDIFFIEKYFEELLFISRYYFDQCFQNFVKTIINHCIYNMDISDSKFIYIKKLCYQYPRILQSLILPEQYSKNYNFKKLSMLNQTQFIQEFNSTSMSYIKSRHARKKILQYILKYYQIEQKSNTNNETIDMKILTFNEKYNQLAQNIWNNPNTRKIKRILRQELKNNIEFINIEEKFIFYLFLICDNNEQLIEFQYLLRKMVINQEKSLYYIARFHNQQIQFLHLLYLDEQKYKTEILRTINFTIFIKYVYLNQNKIFMLQQYVFNPKLQSFYDYAYRSLYIRKMSYLFRGKPLLNAVFSNISELLGAKYDLILKNLFKLVFQTGCEKQLIRLLRENRSKLQNNLIVKVFLGENVEKGINQMISEILENKNINKELELALVYLVFPESIPNLQENRMLLDELVFKNLNEIDFYFLLIILFAQENYKNFANFQKNFVESNYIKLLTLRQTDYILKKLKCQLKNSKILQLIEKRQAILLQFMSIEDKFEIFERSITDSILQSSFNIVEQIFTYIHKMQHDEVNQFLELCQKHSYKINQKYLFSIINYISSSQISHKIYTYLLLYQLSPNHTNVILNAINKYCTIIPLEYRLSMDLLKIIHGKQLNYLNSEIIWFVNRVAAKNEPKSSQLQKKKVFNVKDFRFFASYQQNILIIYLKHSLEIYEMKLLDTVLKSDSIEYKIILDKEIRKIKDVDIQLKPFNIEPQLL